MKTVAVVDYGMGNLRSVSQAVRHVAALAPGDSFTVVVTSNPEEVRAAERVVLPGQGAMADCMRLIGGDVVRFRLEGRLQPDGSRYKVPQMGWNRVYQMPQDGGGEVHPIWAGVPDGAYFYFVHSYYARPADRRDSAGETEYGARFTCALARDNIFATQFHPEKSADHGLALYRNFLHWNP